VTASLRNAGNARRQKAYRLRQIAAGRIAVNIWLTFETMQCLKALAAKRRISFDKTIECAIDAAWIDAGKP
jgi:hypothetical protein